MLQIGFGSFEFSSSNFAAGIKSFRIFGDFLSSCLQPARQLRHQWLREQEKAQKDRPALASYLSMVI